MKQNMDFKNMVGMTSPTFTEVVHNCITIGQNRVVFNHIYRNHVFKNPLYIKPGMAVAGASQGYRDSIWTFLGPFLAPLALSGPSLGAPWLPRGSF